MITLLTDFGCDSLYVAQMKGAILRIAPNVPIFDITHSIPPQDRFQGAIALLHCVPFFPDGTIHLAVVDPGVGTGRKLLAIRLRWNTQNATDTHYLFVPDNGIATFLLDRSPQCEVIHLDRPEFQGGTVSHTFHGRDILAPLAARLFLGATFEQFGQNVARDSMNRPQIERIAFPEVRFSPDKIEGEIIFIDSFGNLITNISRAFQGEVGRKYPVRIAGKTFSCPFFNTYGQSAPGEWLMLFGSNDLLEIARTNANASRELGITTGTPFIIHLR